MSLEARLEAATTAYQKLQLDLQNLVEARQKLDAQLSENEMVQKEFATLKSHNTVYKLIGPGLAPQEQAEAKANVQKRLEFIRGELKRVDAQIKETSEKAEKTKVEIVQLQTSAQEVLQGKTTSGPSRPAVATA